MDLYQQFEESNRKIREQKMIEKSRTDEVRCLIKIIKQELIQAQKERDNIRNIVQVQRKQLGKHTYNLEQQQLDKKNALYGINSQMGNAVVLSTNKLNMLSPAPKKCGTPTQAKLGQSIDAFKSVSSSHNLNQRQNMKASASTIKKDSGKI